MAIITIPAAVQAAIGGLGYGQVRYDMAESSDATGDTAVRLFGPPRWRFALQSPAWSSLAEAGAWESMVLQLRGQVNVLAMWDLLRPAPAGTLRGAPWIDVALAAGATAAVLANAVGTLKAGDWLQVSTGLGSSQTIKLTADAASTVLTSANAAWVNGSAAAANWVNGSAAPATWSVSGRVSITFEAPLRAAYAARTAVAWDKPLVYCRMQGGAPSWKVMPAGPSIEGFALDLLETFA